VIYLLYTIHVLLCIFLILVVLLQQGKGADLSVFGGGSTMAAFGARSATTLLHRLTVGAFVAFVLTTLAIAYLQARVAGGTVMEGVPGAPAAATATPVPAAPATAAPAEAAPAPADPTPPPAN
jgi:preprotein translocase subunit SecG